MSESGSSPLSLRHRLLLAGGLFSVLITAATAALVLVSWRLHDDLERATDSYLEEQRIAEQMHGAVMRQLAMASAFPGARDGSVQAEFLDAGMEVDRLMRLYLSRDLDSEERLQLERVRTEHQRLEVAAIRAGGQYRRGLEESGEASMTRVVLHSGAFIDAVNAFLELRSSDDELQQRQDRMFALLYLVGTMVAGLALLATFGLFWAIQRRVARPLAELATATQRMAAGDLSVRVAPGPDRELQDLADGFNRMVESLERTNGQLAARNTELEEALEQIRATQAELVQVEKLSAIGRMTAGFAHEINNPLASVLGYAQLLESRLSESPPPGVDELQEDFLGPILDEGQRARHLVRTLLGMSRRAGSGLRPVPLRESIEAVCTLRKYAFKQAGLRIDMDVPDVWVRAEPQVLQGVILNLVNNAFDAMVGQPDGVLRIRTRPEDGMVELVIEDEGPGFDDPERVFEPFFTTKPVGEGTGLGLALAHRFVTGFGGTIAADNGDGGGARITIRLPTATPGEASEDVERSAAEAGAATDGKPPAPRILVVEDEAPLRRLQERILGQIEATVTVADSAAAARDVLAREHVDLVISDVRMPGESGLDLFEWVRREQPELADRFLFVTGDLSAIELVEIAEERPERLLQKPFQVSEYLSRVTAALG